MRRQRGWIFLGMAVAAAATTLVLLSAAHFTTTGGESLDAGAIATQQRQRQIGRALAAQAALGVVYEERDILALAGLSLWLDGNDAETLFADTDGLVPAGVGSPVALWKDKSGGGHDVAQSEAAQQPLLAAGGNGRTLVQFDGNDRLQSLSAIIAYQGGVTSFIVWTADAVATAQTLLATQSASLAADWRLGADATLRWRSGTGTPVETTQAATAATRSLSSGVTGATTARQWANGGNPAQTAATFVSVNATVQFDVGSDGAQAFSGTIAEVLQFSRPLSDLERERVEGYLATKWSLVGSLPEAHRYKRPHPVPCPADPAAAAANLYRSYDDHGLETRDDVLHTCAAQVGLLPWQSLGLSRRDAFDTYGRPFTYAVTPTAGGATGVQRSAFCGSATTVLDYAADAQRLRVSADGNDTGATDAPSVPIAVVLSHGPDRVGAYGPNRARAPLPAASADADATQLANYDESSSDQARRDFAAAPVLLDRLASYFDDMVWSVTAPGLLSLAPASAQCP